MEDDATFFKPDASRDVGPISVFDFQSGVNTPYQAGKMTPPNFNFQSVFTQ